MKKLLCTVLIASMSLVPVSSAFAYDLPARTIAVSGRGVVTAEPDTAEINLSISTNGTTASDAQNKNNEIFNKASDALKAMGIKEEDIKSRWYNVYPERDYENGNKVTGYSVENSFTVKTDDKDNVGKYVDEALKAGVTGVSGISFSLENPQYYYGEALKLAVKNARESAETIKDAIGAESLSVYSVEEQSSRYSYSTTNSIMKEEAAADMASGANMVSTEITYDDIEVTASINAVFSY